MFKNIISKEAKDGWRMQIQKFASFLVGMIMPVIGVIIAWGLWTAMFLYSVKPNGYISHGWFKVPSLGKLVGPGMKYLIPTLIAVCAGKMVYQTRGSMIAAFVIFTAIVGTQWTYNEFDDVIAINNKSLAGKDPNQIVTAMILGPLSAWVLKKIEGLYMHRIRPGFEMLFKNFGLALLAILIGIGVFFSWGWVLFGITYVLTSIVKGFGTNKWIAPFMTIFTEPIRTIFLNNALNHGVMSPIGVVDVEAQIASGTDSPSSLFFMFGGNAGPGFGLLLAHVVWKKGKERYTAGGASVIQLIGGIHEVYYVFVLGAPIMLLATIGGAATSMTIISYLGAGTSAIVSPGSIISVIAMSPSAYHIAINLLAVFAGAGVTFLIASVIMKSQKKNQVENSRMSVQITDDGMIFNDHSPKSKSSDFDFKKVKKIAVVCDAGVGSSAMAAGIIRKWVEKNKIPVQVAHSSIKDVQKDVDIIVTMNSFVNIVKEKNPQSYVFGVDQFLGAQVYDGLYQKLLMLQEKVKQK